MICYALCGFYNNFPTSPNPETSKFRPEEKGIVTLPFEVLGFYPIALRKRTFAMFDLHINVRNRLSIA